jgi:hypothetical protein
MSTAAEPISSAISEIRTQLKVLYGKRWNYKKRLDGAKNSAERRELQAQVDDLQRRIQPLQEKVDEADETRVKRLKEELESKVLSLTTNEEWLAYLATQRHFWHYSPSNAQLIILQNPEATRCNNIKRWNELGRRVMKGEQGLWIRRPKAVRKSRLDKAQEADQEDTDEAAESAAKDEEGRTIFVWVRGAFDISQTEGPPLPEAVKLLQGEDVDGSFARLQLVAESAGLMVKREALRDRLNGYYEAGAKCITVSSSIPGLASVKTLAHELGHHFAGHGSCVLARQDREMEAESIAYIVCGDLSIDSSQYSLGYITGWQNEDPVKAANAIRAAQTTIHKASRKIISGLETLEMERQTTWEAATEDEQALVAQQVADQFHSQGKTGQTLASRDEALTRLRRRQELLNHLSQREAKARAFRSLLIERDEDLRADREREYQEREVGGYER